MFTMWVALMGCEELTPCERAAKVDEPELVIGWGEERFARPLEDGELVQPVFGGQGGQHLWLALETRGFVPGEHRGLFADDEDVPLFLAELVGLDDGEIWSSEGWNYFAMEGDESLAEIALGEFVVTDVPGVQRYLLSVTGTDVCGTELADEVEIALPSDPYDY